jgi:hypothetical protein
MITYFKKFVPSTYLWTPMFAGNMALVSIKETYYTWPEVKEYPYQVMIECFYKGYIRKLFRTLEEALAVYNSIKQLNSIEDTCGVYPEHPEDVYEKDGPIIYDRENVSPHSLLERFPLRNWEQNPGEEVDQELLRVVSDIYIPWPSSPRTDWLRNNEKIYSSDVTY